MCYTHGKFSHPPSPLRTKSKAVSSEERRGVYVMRSSLFELPAVGHKLACFGIRGRRLENGPVFPLTRCGHEAGTFILDSMVSNMKHTRTRDHAHL